MILLLGAPALGGMVTLLIVLVIFLLVAGVLFWAVQRLCAAFGVPEPIRTVIIVLFVLIVVIGIVYYVFGGGTLLR